MLSAKVLDASMLPMALQGMRGLSDQRRLWRLRRWRVEANYDAHAGRWSAPRPRHTVCGEWKHLLTDPAGADFEVGHALSSISVGNNNSSGSYPRRASSSNRMIAKRSLNFERGFRTLSFQPVPYDEDRLPPPLVGGLSKCAAWRWRRRICRSGRWCRFRRLAWKLGLVSKLIACVHVTQEKN